jgi:hypothetical protein
LDYHKGEESAEKAGAMARTLNEPVVREYAKVFAARNKKRAKSEHAATGNWYPRTWLPKPRGKVT